MDTVVPDAAEVRAMFEGLALADPKRYGSMNLDDTFVGFCIAKGMAPKLALTFVAENSVKEDGK